MSKRKSRAEWIEICEAYDRSGETAAVFARQRDVRRGTLEWWRWKLGQEQALKSKRRSFVEVVSEPSVVAGRAVVRIGEVAIEFSDGAPPASWVAELAGRC